MKSPNDRRGRAPWRLAVMLGVLALVAGGFTFALSSVTGRPGPAIVTLGILVLALAVYVASIVLAVVVHELGHYVAGRGVGFELRMFVVGPFGLRREKERKVAFRVRPMRLLGFVAMSPPDDDRVLRRYAWFVVGGPAASLLYAGGLFAALRALGGPGIPHLARGANPAAIVLPAVLSLLLVGAVVVLPGTLLPFRARRLGGFPTDAMWLLTLWRGGDEARRLSAMLILTRLLHAGTPANELPWDLVEDAIRVRDGSLTELNAQTLLWGRAMAFDPARAAKAFERHAEIRQALGKALVEPLQSWSALVLATHEIYVRRDAERGARWLDAVRENPDPALIASFRVVEAMLAALRDAPDRFARVEAAEAALGVAEARTTQSWAWDRQRLADIRNGWPHAETFRSSVSV